MPNHNSDLFRRSSRTCGRHLSGGGDVEGLAGGEGGGHGHLRLGAGNFLAVHTENDVGGRAGFRGFEDGFDDDVDMT